MNTDVNADMNTDNGTPSWKDVQKLLREHSIESGIVAHTVTVTPDLAATLLGRNMTGNRALPKSVVDRMARIFKSGKFKFNGESLKLSADGTLVDGQTRLSACVDTGISFDTVILTGLPDDSFDSLDQGRKRRVCDALARHGVEQAPVVAAALRGIDAIPRRVAPWSGRMGLGEDADEAIEWVKNNPRIAHSVKAVRTDVHLVPASLLTALHFLFAEKDAEAADRFFSDLATGAQLALDDPVGVLRNRLIEDNRVRAERRERVNIWNVVSLIVLSWNARRAGKTLKRLPVRAFETAADGQSLLPIIKE